MEGRYAVAMVNEIYWPDAELSGVAVDYDTVKVSLACVDGVGRTISGQGYIAMSFAPCWDELVVSECAVSDNSELQRSALARLETSAAFRLDSGSTARNSRAFKTLSLVFADGSELVLVAHEFLVDEKQ